jgi:hypothetical protein
VPARSGPIGPERNISSPPTPAAANPAPWNASQNETVLKRPVATRASLSAISIASEPLGATSTFERVPGAIEASLRASATAGSFVKRRGANVRSSSWRLSASRSRGWPWPMWWTLLPWKSM